MKMNNKGFTLVELLGVIVILVAILLIAIPTVTSSVERSKAKQLDSKIELIKSAAELYISDIKTTKTNCQIPLLVLSQGNYITQKTIIDPYSNNDGELRGWVVYTKAADGKVNYQFCNDTRVTGCDVALVCG